LIVVDASAMVELLLGTPTGSAVAARLSVARETVHVPHLLDLEVASALRVLEGRGTIGSSDAARALADLLGLPMLRYAHDALLARVWQLRGNLTPYDAAYVALAEHLAAPVATCDARLASAPGLRVAFELFP
jgi:predicted nucleic acid-binding protein